MKRNFLKKFMIVGFVFVLLISDFAILGTSIVNAVYEELESQTKQIANTSIEFDAYFEENSNVKHSKEINIRQGDNLYINLNLRDTGVLNNGKIKITNPNFEIVKENIDNEYIESINTDLNEINLNQIIYGNDVKIAIPIKFKKQNNIPANYFEQEAIISLEGEYKDSQGKANNVNGNISIRPIWTDNVEVQMTQEIEKYLVLENSKTLLQQKIELNVVDNILPVKSTKIEVQVPNIEGRYPEVLSILKDGKEMAKEKYSYSNDSGKLTITNENVVDEQGKAKWGNGKEEYKIIYNYVEIGEVNRNIQLSTLSDVEVYTKGNINTQNQVSVEISKSGAVVTGRKQMTPDLNKGYMYFNSGNETQYMEKLALEISEVDSITEVQVNKNGEYFVDQNGFNYDVTGSVYYKAIKFNKENISEILGDAGSVQIQGEDGSIISNINNSTQADESGNILVAVDNINSVKIAVNGMQKYGNLNIEITKAVKSDTGYSREQLKRFNKLKSVTSVLTSGVQYDVISEANLLDTVTEATLGLDKTNLSTTETNKGVQISTILKTSSSNNDLYKNPTIRLEFPEEISNVKINQIDKLYLDENQMTVVEANLFEENGRRVIGFKLEGEQTNYSTEISQGIQLLINADIDINVSTPNKNSELKMIYTNENGNEGQYEKVIGMNFNSKHGLLIYNQLSDFNENKDVIKTINNEIVESKLDLNSSEKIATQNITFVNNHDKAIDNLVLVGKLPTKSTETIDGKKVQSDIGLQLAQSIITNNENAKVYYSDDEKASKDDESKWTENPENARQYKVVLEKLDELDSLQMSIKLRIPEGISYNTKTYLKTETDYSYMGQELNSISAIKLATEEIVVRPLNNTNLLGKTLELDGIKVNMVPITEGRVLEDSEDVREGQIIKYQLMITNTSNDDIENLKLVAEHTNAIYWGEEYVEAESGTDEPVYNVYFRELPELTKKELNIEKITPGETINLEYQISINDDIIPGTKTSGEIKIDADGMIQQKIELNEIEINQANLKATLLSLKSETYALGSADYNEVMVVVKNLMDTEVNDVIVEIQLDGMSYLDNEKLDFMKAVYYNGEAINGEFLEYDEENNIVKFKIYDVQPGEEDGCILIFSTRELEYDIDKSETSMYANVYINSNEKYKSNVWTEIVYQTEAVIEIEQVGSIEGTTVKDGDVLTYTTTMKNINIFEEEIGIYDYVEKHLIINEAYFEHNGVRTEITDWEDNYIELTTQFNIGDEIKLVIEVLIDEEKIGWETIKNTVVIDGSFETVYSNVVTYNFLSSEEIEQGEDGSGEGNLAKYNISGLAWVDSNENGIRDNGESILNGTKVNLINEETEQIIKTTEVSGSMYEFEEVTRGKYYVAFEYDNTKYRITEYKKSGVDETQNSDAVSKEINGKIYAVTDILDVARNLSNIDVGFIENEKFDLSLQKYISKIIIQNGSGTKVTNYNKSKLAKIEINSKYIANSTILIEYQIEVKNEGELAGYVNEIVDYIPNDLKFSSELNKDWHQAGDGQIYNSSLANDKLEAGGSKIVTLTLTKNMTADNTGLIVNTAEISKALNELNISDIDSTPGNRVQGEDDIDTAEVIISIGTGIEIILTGIGIIIILVTVLGITYYMKKKEEYNVKK